MTLSPRRQILAGLAGCALLILSVPTAVVLSAPTLGGATPRVAGAASRPSIALPRAQVGMVIVPGIRRGPDKKLHDAFTPTDVSARAGQQIVLTVYNYDGGDHSITAPELHLNLGVGYCWNGKPA